MWRRRVAKIAPTPGPCATAPVLTFSGTHPFRREHAGTRGERAEELVKRGLCPRCEGPLYPNKPHPTKVRPGDPYPIWRPAGSRASACRCIPICDQCQTVEAIGAAAATEVPNTIFDELEGMEDDERAMFADGVQYVIATSDSPTIDWPVDRLRQIAGMAVIHAWIDTGRSRFKRITVEEAAKHTDLKSPQHPGGWADPDN